MIVHVYLALTLSHPVSALIQPEPEDHHVRPPGWDLLVQPEPEPLYAEPEYPLAVGFDAANANNYLPNGIESYKWVVVHTMQGSYGGTISWFKNPSAQVSTQYVMRASDGEVTQMVLDKDRAYHVGNNNRYALGIEHEGFVDDPAKWYTWATYSSSALLTRWLTHKHAIPVDRDHVAAHSELPNQSHTDPGDGWNWTLYMALIHDVVLPGEIRGVVVDRSAPCTLTANKATWLKRTAMPTDTLADSELCSIPADTELAYWHARTDFDGHHLLTMPPGEGPCAGINGLDVAAYAIAADWSALCPPAAMAIPGAAIQLDGGADIIVAADGTFVVTAGPGAHTIDAHAADHEPASEPVDLAVYPGARVVLALDPVPAPDPTGDPESTSGEPDPTTGATSPDPTSETTADLDATGDTSSDPGALTTSAAPTEQDPGLASLPGLPDSYGADDDAGACACNDQPAGATPSLLILAALGSRRRRR